jgi:LmbE family N-acetylglucosaminyl deacetylase
MCEKSVSECYPDSILKEECISALEELSVPKNNLIFLNFEVREFPRDRQAILESMIKIGKDIRPDLIIAPSSFDTHQDHHVIYQESIRAFKKMSSIWGMEHPWNNLSFRTDIFIELKREHIEKKIKALSKYNSQSIKPYFNEQYILSSALTRGMMIDKPYAEVFEAIRMIM